IAGGAHLPATTALPAVRPRMGEGNEPTKLAGATRTSLQLAEQNHLESIAFPAISTGVFGYPLDSCAQIMLKTIIDYTSEELLSLKDIIVCLYDDRAFQVFAAEFQRQLDALDKSAKA